MAQTVLPHYVPILPRSNTSQRPAKQTQCFHKHLDGVKYLLGPSNNVSVIKFECECEGDFFFLIKKYRNAQSLGFSDTGTHTGLQQSL